MGDPEDASGLQAVLSYVEEHIDNDARVGRALRFSSESSASSAVFGRMMSARHGFSGSGDATTSRSVGLTIS